MRTTKYFFAITAFIATVASNVSTGAFASGGLNAPAILPRWKMLHG